MKPVPRFRYNFGMSSLVLHSVATCGRCFGCFTGIDRKDYLGTVNRSSEWVDLRWVGLSVLCGTY